MTGGGAESGSAPPPRRRSSAEDGGILVIVRVRTVWTATTVGVLTAIAFGWAYRRMVAGDLVIDLSIGRSIRELEEGTCQQRR